MSGAYDRYIKKHENDSKQEKTQQKTQQKAQNKSNENLSTYERFQKSNPDYDYDTGIAYYNSESFQRKQKQQQQTTQPDSVHIEKQTTNNNKTVTPTVRSSSNKLLQDIKAANGNTTKVKKGSNIERKSAGPSVRSATDKLLNDIVTARKERNNAIKEEYESIPERNIFERLPNWLKREYSTFYGMFPQTLPEDYPNYREDYNRKQELAAEYEKIRNEEAIQSLRDMGMTEAELRALGQDVMRQSDIDAMVAAGFSDEDIRKHADYLYKRGERAKAKLYDLTAGKGKVGPNDLSFDDYMQILSNYQMPEVSKDAKERPVSNSLYTLVTNPFESVANTLGNAYNYLAGKPIRHNDSVTETIRDTVNESIGNPLGRIAYSGALSIGDMAVAQGIDFALGGGGAISAGIQAVEKASEVSNDAVDRGLTPNRIFASTIASAVTTFVTEKISMGKLSKIAEKGLTDYSAKEIAKTLGASFVTEGAQEGMEDVADWITGSLISWDKNEFNTAYKNYLESGESKEEAVKHVISDKLVELISDVVMGGIGGGVMGGVNTGFAYATGRIQPSPHVNTENVLQSDTALNQLVEAVQTIDTTNLSGEFAQRVEHAQEVAQKPSEELTVEDVVDMANAVNEQAGPDNNLAQTIQEINYQANYERNINEYIETGKIEEKENELPIEKAAREQAQLAVKDYEQTEIQQKRAAERQLNQELKNFNRNIENNRITDTTSNEEYIRESLEKSATYFENEAAAKNFIENYNGQNLLAYAQVSYQAYNAGESGQSFETFLENAPKAKYLVQQNIVSEDYLKTIFYNGQNTRTINTELPVVKPNANRGKVTGIKGELTELEEAFARRLGIEIRNDGSEAEYRGKFISSITQMILSDTSDNKYQTMIHEMMEYARTFNPKGMEIADRALVKMFVEKSGERAFIEAVNNYKRTYREAAMNAPEGSALKAEAGKTFQSAQDEFLNDAVSYIFSTEEGMQNLVDYIMNDKTTTQEEKVSAIETIKSWVDHLIQTIKNFLSGHKTEQSGYKYAERLGLKSEELELISRKLLGVIDEARENLEGLLAESETKNEQKTEAEEAAHSVEVTDEIDRQIEEGYIQVNGDNDVRFSIATYDNPQSEGELSGRDSLKEQQKTEDRMEKEMSGEQKTLYKEVKDFLKEQGTLEDVRHSISVTDSDGNQLTKDQQKYFANSKVRDENGNLLRVFHGTGANFTIFDLGKARDSEDIEAFFFSANQEEAEGYGNAKEYYLNITNPADYDTAYKIFHEERRKKPEGAGTRTRERLQEMGYDGVIAYDESSPEYTEYLAFSPEQIKLVSNTKPTKSEDIRFSIDVKYNEAYENNDISEMDKLVEQAARAAGYDSPKLYHGTGAFGFTEFDLSKMDDRSTIFLTSNPEIASTYSGSRKQKNIAERFNKDIEALTSEELVEELNDNRPDDGTDSKYEFFDEAKKAELEKKNEESISELMKLIRAAEKTNGYQDSDAKKNIDEIKTLLYLNSKDQLLHDEETNKRLGARLWFLAQTKAGDILDSSIRERFGEMEEDYRKASTLSKKEDASILESAMEGYIYEAYTQEEARKLLSENAGRGIYSLYAKLGNCLIIDAKKMNWDALISWTENYTKLFDENNTYVKIEDGRAYLMSSGSKMKNKPIFDVSATDVFLSQSDEERHEDLLSRFHHSYYSRVMTQYGNTTRSAAKFAKEHEYDSVIFRNIRDNGGRNSDVDFDVLADVYALFNPNDIKSADPITYNDDGEIISPSERFKSDKEDIRYSIDVPFIDSFLEIDEEVKKTESALKEMIDKKMDLDSDISKKMISDVASYIKNKYNSTYKKEWLESSITAIFKFLQNNNVRMEDIMYIMSDIAKPILENVKNAEPEQEKLYKDIVNTVKSYKIKLDAGQKQEVINAYGSYKNFVDSMRGKITLSNDGIALDNIWTELVDKTGGKLSYGTVPNDQPIELANLINSLNPTYASLEGQALEDAAMDVSLDIISQFYVHNSMTEAAKAVKGELTKRANKFKEDYKKRYNEAIKQVEAEKAMNIKRLSEEIDSLTAEQQEAIRTGDSVNQAMIENIRNDYKRRLDRLRAESNEKIARAKAQYQNSWINKNLRRERSTLKNRVLREVKALQNMIAHPQEGASKHVPINLIKPTIEMLEAINLDNGGRNKAIADRLKKMSEVYESFKNDDTYSFDYDERIASDIKELQEMFAKRSYADLSITELQRVIEIVAALKTQIKNANNLILQDKLKDAKIAAEGAINDVKGSRRHDNAAMNALNRYGNLHLNAYREFRKLSGYKDGALMDIYNDLDEGSKKEMQIQKDLGAIFQNVLEGQKNQKEVKKFISTKENDLVDIGITDKNGKPIKITRAMRMSLIMHSMNAGNMRHVLGSGITVPNMYYFEKGKMEEAYAKGTNYRFVDYTELLNAIKQNNQAKIEELTKQAQKRVEDMKNDLSEWEKDFLKDAEKMFHEETGKYINETSMKLKGYALARVKNYFPIKTDRHFTSQDWTGLIQNGSLEGSGSLKERVISTKPILLEDITNVIQRQIRFTSKYAGLAVAVRNFETIMKQTSRDDNGQLHNLYETIDKVWGSSDTNWLRNLMQDIQGGRKESDSALANFFTKLRGNFAAATLNMNLGVAIKQAASYPTAAAVTGWKPLLRNIPNLVNGFRGKGIAELEAINPLLWYREQGYGTQDLADAKSSDIMKKLPPNVQKALGWTQMFDTATVRTLEYVAKDYVDHNYKDLKKGTGVYWNTVSDVFTRIVEETQPNYSKLQQADIIRNPNALNKMLVMFKTQPMQNFGIIYDAMGELNAAVQSGNQKWTKEATSKAANAITSQIVSASVFSVMTMIGNILKHRTDRYKDEDDEWSIEKILQEFGISFASCLVGGFIGGSVIYEGVKFVLEKFVQKKGARYYGLEVSAVEVVNDIVTNAGKVATAASSVINDKTSAGKENAAKKSLDALLTFGETVGEYIGVPVRNMKQLMLSMAYYSIDAVEGIKNGDFKVSGDRDIFDNWEIPTQYERIYEATMNGDTDEAERLTQQLVKQMMKEKKEELKSGEVTEDAIIEAVKNDIVEKYKDIVKEDFMEGDISAEEAERFLVEEIGKTENDAFFQVRKWDTGENKYDIMKDNISKAAEDPTPENRKAINEEIKILLDHGVDKGTISSEITKAFKSEYIDLYNKNKAADLNSILRSALVAAGYTDDQAKKKLEDWLK